MKRRRFIQSSVAAGVTATPLGQALGRTTPLTKTPSDFEGPFYPVGGRKRNNDLIAGEPRGPVLRLEGIVLNVHGEPISSAVVDIWHTDLIGRYDHPQDPSKGERWPDFAYWGEAKTDDAGKFSFRTYVPGIYSQRPVVHVHYKVWHEQKELLTSQLYFEELGGTRGESMHPELGELQTTSLMTMDEDNQKAVFDIVV